MSGGMKMIGLLFYCEKSLDE